MTYLFSEILGSLIVVALLAFALGWFLRGARDELRNRGDSNKG